MPKKKLKGNLCVNVGQGSGGGFTACSSTLTSSPKRGVPSDHVDISKLVKVGEQAGSNPGGFYENPVTKVRYYIKWPKGDTKAEQEDRARNEVLAAKLYELAGIKVPEISLASHPDKPGEIAVASKIIPNLKEDVAGLRDGKYKGVKRGFAVDAWLANWDVVGFSGDNMLTDGKQAVRLDTGGALRYRAQGTKKTASQWNSSVNELETMRDPMKKAGRVFSTITDLQVKNSVLSLLTVPRAKIIAAVAQHGPRNKTESMMLINRLLTRRWYMADKVGFKMPKPQLFYGEQVNGRHRDHSGGGRPQADRRLVEAQARPATEAEARSAQVRGGGRTSWREQLLAEAKKRLKGNLCVNTGQGSGGGFTACSQHSTSKTVHKAVTVNRPKGVDVKAFADYLSAVRAAGVALQGGKLDEDAAENARMFVYAASVIANHGGRKGMTNGDIQAHIEGTFGIDAWSAGKMLEKMVEKGYLTRTVSGKSPMGQEMGVRYAAVFQSKAAVNKVLKGLIPPPRKTVDPEAVIRASKEIQAGKELMAMVRREGHKLTLKEFRAVREYTGGAYEDMRNAMMRRRYVPMGGRDKAEIREMNRHLKSAMEKLTGFKGVSYRQAGFGRTMQTKTLLGGKKIRSLSPRSEQEFLSRMEQLKTSGKPFRFRAWASTSQDPDTTSMSASTVLYTIKGKGGGRDVSGLSRFTTEEEVLYSPRSRFRVVGYEKGTRRGQPVVNVELEEITSAFEQLLEGKKKLKGNLCVNTGQGSGGGFTACSTGGKTEPRGRTFASKSELSRAEALAKRMASTVVSKFAKFDGFHAVVKQSEENSHKIEVLITSRQHKKTGMSGGSITIRTRSDGSVQVKMGRLMKTLTKYQTRKLIDLEGKNKGARAIRGPGTKRAGFAESDFTRAKKENAFRKTQMRSAKMLTMAMSRMAKRIAKANRGLRRQVPAKNLLDLLFDHLQEAKKKLKGNLCVNTGQGSGGGFTSCSTGGGKTTEIEIKTGGGKTTKVSAEVFGDVGVHVSLISAALGKSGDKASYTVTHVPTGFAVGRFHSKAKAVVFAEHVGAIDVTNMKAAKELVAVGYAKALGVGKSAEITGIMRRMRSGPSTVPGGSALSDLSIAGLVQKGKTSAFGGGQMWSLTEMGRKVLKAGSTGKRKLEQILEGQRKLKGNLCVPKGKGSGSGFRKCGTAVEGGKGEPKKGRKKTQESPKKSKGKKTKEKSAKPQGALSKAGAAILAKVRNLPASTKKKLKDFIDTFKSLRPWERAVVVGLAVAPVPGISLATPAFVAWRRRAARAMAEWLGFEPDSEFQSLLEAALSSMTYQSWAKLGALTEELAAQNERVRDILEARKKLRGDLCVLTGKGSGGGFVSCSKGVKGRKDAESLMAWRKKTAKSIAHNKNKLREALLFGKGDLAKWHAQQLMKRGVTSIQVGSQSIKVKGVQETKDFDFVATSLKKTLANDAAKAVASAAAKEKKAGGDDTMSAVVGKLGKPQPAGATSKKGYKGWESPEAVANVAKLSIEYAEAAYAAGDAKLAKGWLESAVAVDPGAHITAPNGLRLKAADLINADPGVHNVIIANFKEAQEKTVQGKVDAALAAAGVKKKAPISLGDPQKGKMAVVTSGPEKGKVGSVFWQGTHQGKPSTGLHTPDGQTVFTKGDVKGIYTAVAKVPIAPAIFPAKQVKETEKAVKLEFVGVNGKKTQQWFPKSQVQKVSSSSSFVDQSVDRYSTTLGMAVEKGVKASNGFMSMSPENKKAWAETAQQLAESLTPGGNPAKLTPEAKASVAATLGKVTEHGFPAFVPNIKGKPSIAPTDQTKVKVAINKGMKHGTWAHNLPTDQRTAVEDYTGIGYKAINRQMAKNFDPKDPGGSLAKIETVVGRGPRDLYKALRGDRAKDHVPADAIVYRGDALRPEMHEAIKAFQGGKDAVVTNRVFASSSLSTHTAHSFGYKTHKAGSGGKKVMWRVKDGGTYIGSVSSQGSGESEVLYRPGQKFKVVGVHEKLYHGDSMSEQPYDYVIDLIPID